MPAQKRDRIPVNVPWIPISVSEVVLRAVEKAQLSGTAPIVAEFEAAFDDTVAPHHAGERYHSVAVSSGTAALHLACAAFDIGPGDEVLVPDLTILSCAAAVVYTGATPVLCPVDAYGNMTLDGVVAGYSKKTKAVIVVHNQGVPAPIQEIAAFCQSHSLFLIEDCAQALCSYSDGRVLGSWGDCATYSLYANKLVTTGEGGVVCTKTKQLAARVRSLRNLAHHPTQRFYHEEIGYNYRLSSLQAACGLGMLAELDQLIERKQAVLTYYAEHMPNSEYLRYPTREVLETQKKKQDSHGILPWVWSVLVQEAAPFSRDDFRERLAEKGIETRTYFFPLHLQPALAGVARVVGDTSMADSLAASGCYVPSGTGTTEAQCAAVVAAVQEVLAGAEL